MPIYRGSGGSGSSNNSALANQVTLDAEAAAESAANAATSAANAATSATDAATSATNAANSATSAATSSGSASTSATTATTKATEAATSATAAATSATTAATEATNAGTSATTAGSQATIATTKATEAAASATTATTKATEAATSATASATSATASATSATASATSATASAASATAAAASAAAAAASQEAIDGLYLGAQSSDPTLDLNGDPVTVGDWYFNTTINKSKIYNGSSWDILTSNGSVTSVTGTGTVNGVTLTGTVTTAGNLTLGGTLSGITASQLNSQNISQWTNDSGYITSYTETDTLDSVTDRGATTTNAVTVGNLTSTGIDDNATSTAVTLDSSGNVSTTNRLRIGTGSSDTRITLNNEGTEQTNSSNYIRGVSGQLIYNSASSVHKWEIAGSEKMRIDASGNVGIGTTSPASIVEIIGVNPKLTINANDVVNGRNATLSLISGTSLDPSGTCQIMYGASNSTTAGTLTFVEGDGTTESMRIDSSGNVGIGRSPETSPQHIFDVSSGAAAARSRVTSTSSVQIIGNAGSGGLYIDSEGSAADIIFRNTGSYSERMRINSSGDVGIGTASPASFGTQGVQIGAYGATLSDRVGYQSMLGNNLYHDGTNDRYIVGAGATAFIQSLGSSIWFSAPTGTAGAVATLTERMRIDASGNVNINGGVNGNAKLQVAYSGAAFPVPATSTPTLQISQGSGQTGSGDINGNGGLELTGSVFGAGYGVKFYGSDEGTLIIGQRSNSAIWTERMRISSSGNLLVGTTTITSATDTRSEIRSGSFSEIALQLSTAYNGGSNKSMVYFVDGGNDVCGNIYINASSNTTAYSTSSDERLKENITDANSSGSLIDQLKVRQFDWKNSNVHQDYGFIAQELYEKVPIAVYRPETGSGDYDESGTWGVDYSKLVPMLVKEIQDLRARVAQLEEA